ncbi:MAG: hypothetical protein ACYDC6_05545 [Acidobacteriaceae bacterium]
MKIGSVHAGDGGRSGPGLRSDFVLIMSSALAPGFHRDIYHPFNTAGGHDLQDRARVLRVHMIVVIDGWRFQQTYRRIQMFFALEI